MGTKRKPSRLASPLRELRGRSGVSQTDLAKAWGCSAANIHSIEQRERVTVDTWSKYVEAMEYLMRRRVATYTQLLAEIEAEEGAARA
jgi:DNA-binding XRE family transcriptional regulator